MTMLHHALPRAHRSALCCPAFRTLRASFVRKESIDPVASKKPVSGTTVLSALGGVTLCDP